MQRAVLFVFLLAGVVFAQEPQPGVAPGSPPPNRQTGRGEGRAGGMRLGGTGGTITAIKGDTLTVKGLDGNEATVKISDKTQFRKDQKEAKLADFKSGDLILVRGEQNPDGSWAAQTIISRSDLAQMLTQGGGGVRMGGGPGAPGQGGMQMQVLAEGLGKQFIAGKVKEISGTKLTIERPDNQVQTIEVDENTSFRMMGGPAGGDSVTLADIKPGFSVFGRGALNKDGVFVPAVLNVSERAFMGSTVIAPAPKQ